MSSNLLKSKITRYAGIVLGALVWLANSSNPPNGRTGAPFDGHCNNCHTGNANGYNGTVTISGLPSTIAPNTTYNLNLDLTAIAGSPSRGGYQLVAVDGNNANCGNLSVVNGQSGTEFSGGREYIEQRGSKLFSGGSVDWDFQWTSPASVPGNTVRFYFIGNFCNGSGSSGDFPIAASATFDFAGAPPVSAIITNVSNVSCFGGNNGSATVEASGGVPPYTYAWSNGQSGQTAVNLAAGNYTVTVTGSGGSGTATATATITQPPALNQTVSVPGPISCLQPLVTATASASGGVSPYTYAWSDGQTGNQASFSAPGNYSVVATDAAGCTKLNTVQITGNTTPPTALAAPGVAITCVQTTTTVSGSGSSQGPNFTYLWTTVNGNILAGATSLNATVNAAGTYVLRVTNTASGCTSTSSAVVTANTTPPTVTLNTGLLTCADTATTIQANPSAPSTYNWSGPNGFASTVQNPIVQQPGVYNLVVTANQNGCTGAAGITVNQNITPPQVTATDGALNCVATTDTLTAGSNNSVSYSWTGPGGYSANTANAIVNAPGSYIVVVTDSLNGCTASDTSVVTQNIALPTASAVTPEEITCDEPAIQLDGVASSQGQNFIYSWSTANGRIVSGANTLTPTVDTTGEYVLLVTNQTNGCTARDTVAVTQDPLLADTVSNLTPVSCNGGSDGSITISASGGSGSYTYLWSTGDTTATAANLVAGVYNVTVEDGNGCTRTNSATIIEPAILNSNATATAETANGANDGTATAAPTGGTGPYQYTWNTGDTTALIINLSPGNYTVTVEDANGCTSVQTATVNSFNCALSAQVTVTQVSCNGGSDGVAGVQVQGGVDPVTFLWNTGDTTAVVTGLGAGTYTVEILDGNNCPAELTATITQPAVLLANVSATAESGPGANDGTAGASPTGGVSPYSFLWNNGSTTQTISGLEPGAYTVTVTDQNSCTVVRSVVVNAFNCALNISISSVNVQCAGAGNGQATALVAGGAQPLSYLWSNGATTASIVDVQAGQYGVTTTDAEGCSSSASVTITEPAPIQIQVDVTPASCPENNDGSATFVVTGGTGPYQWAGNWNNLAPGNYQLTLTDANGCIQLQSFTVGSNDTEAPTLICPSAGLQACSSAPFAFNLITGDNCSPAGAVPILVSGLPSGSVFPVGVTLQEYRLTDASGNTATCSFQITTIEGPSVTLDDITNDVGNTGQGSISVTVSGGSGSYQFEWSINNQLVSTAEDVTGLFSGTYFLTVLDSNGCRTALDSVVVDNLVNTDNPIADGGDFRVLPNPAVHSIQLEIRNLKVQNGVIYDRYGRWMKNIPGNELESPVEVGDLPSGMYFVRLVLENGQSVSKRWLKMN